MLVPLLVGFVPHQSVVVVGLDGQRQVGPTLRGDLLARELADEQARHLADAVRRAGARRALVVVLTEEPDDGGLPRRGLARQLVAALQDRRVPVDDALLVRAGRWWSYTCRGDCCPASGTPLPDRTPALDHVAAQAAYAGRAVLADRSELVASIAPAVGQGPARRLHEQAHEAFRRAWRRDGAATARDALERWSAALSGWGDAPVAQDDREAARLVATLQEPQVRDAVAAHLLDRPEPLQALLRQLCRRTVAPYDGQVCTLLAWVAYCSGDGALALVALERALASDPACSLAGLLLRLVEQQVPPAQLRAVLRPGRT